MKAAVLALLFCLRFPGVSGTALAQEQKPFKATDYPVAVREVLSWGLLTCKQEGGGKIEFAPDTVRKVDFNGDGRVDYVVDFNDVKCAEAEHIFCGTGGCMTYFLVTMPNGAIRELFGNHIHNYRILPGHPRKVRFRIHHSYCEDGHDKGCFRDIRIGYRKFTPIC